jgi:DNA-binding SARP family transcriptional activator
VDVSLPALRVQVLGPLAVFRDGEQVRLPQSKKTRALLAYLAITGRAHRRDRLCGLLWDVADDPRGALRWSLSKIRPLVDSEIRRSLLADKEGVRLDLEEGALDWRAIRKELIAGVGAVPFERLQELAVAFHGELLEGLDLIDFDEFTAWCAAEREHARKLHAQILAALIERLEGTPARAVPHARELVRIDPLNEEARAHLIRLLALAGRRNEAKAQYESAARMLKELGTKTTGILVSAWREAQSHGSAGVEAPSSSTPRREPAPAVPGESTDGRQRGPSVLVGRQSELGRMVSLLDEAAGGRLTIFLLKGEAGVGKTRLLTELGLAASRRGSTVFEAASYEAEAGRPYGPWIDALRRLPESVVSRGDPAALALLLPGLADAAPQSRDRLFGAVVDLIGACAQPGKPAVVLFDDMHWCDDATAELLHYVARMSLDRPVAIVMGARDGELVDNESATRILRSFRRDGLITEHLLLPLTEQEVAVLVGAMESAADPEEVFALSGGNALLATELAQAALHHGDPIPRSLKEIVSDRLARLAPEAGDVLRWSAILGPTFDVSRLAELVSLDFDRLMHALAELERHSLLANTNAGPGIYAFHHALVHQVAYSEISEPRRKLMHVRVARLLGGLDDPDGTIALELAHHAAVGGDSAMAARACLAAGNRCLRVFANADAWMHARRGLRLVEELPDPERIKLRIELEQLSLGAQWPKNSEAEARRIEALAEQALDAGCPEHARLGFTLVSYLRWYEGAVGEAHRASMRAELVSRGTDDQTRVIGIAEAGRCLVILERDLAQAEALLLEARALAERSGEPTWAVFDGLGLLRLHAGALEEASAAFEQAWAVAKKGGDRLQEFMSLEHLVAVSVHRRNEDQACGYAQELALIGEKLRDGSERSLGRAMLALCRYRKDRTDYRLALDEAIGDLRAADAKQRLAFVLTQAAWIESERGDLEIAAARASEAVELGEVLDKPSETALARAILLRVARERGHSKAAREQAAALAELRGYAKHVKTFVDRELAASGFAPRREPAELGAE